MKEISSVRLDEHGVLQQDAVGDDNDDAPDKVCLPAYGLCVKYQCFVCLLAFNNIVTTSTLIARLQSRD